MLIRSEFLPIEHQDQYLTQELYFNTQAEVDGVINFTGLELFVSDSETGRAISRAMIGIDILGRTAVGDDRGNVFIDRLVEGTYTVDIIVPGYIACSTQIYLSAIRQNQFSIKMISNC